MINDHTGSGSDWTGSGSWKNKDYVSGIGMANLKDNKTKAYITGFGMVDPDEYKNKTYVTGMGMVDLDEYKNKTYVTGLGLVDPDECKNKTYVTGLGLVDLDEYKNKTYVTGLGLVDKTHFTIQSPSMSGTSATAFGLSTDSYLAGTGIDAAYSTKFSYGLGLPNMQPVVGTPQYYSNLPGAVGIDAAYSTKLSYGLGLPNMQPVVGTPLYYSNLPGAVGIDKTLTGWSGGHQNMLNRTELNTHSIFNPNNMYGVVSDDHTISGCVLSNACYNALSVPAVTGMNHHIQDGIFLSSNHSIASVVSLGHTPMIHTNGYSFEPLNSALSVNPAVAGLPISAKDSVSLFSSSFVSNRWIDPADQALATTLAKQDYPLFVNPSYAEFKMKDMADLVYQPFHKSIISPAPSYEPPTLSEDIEINEILVYKLGNIHAAIKESYLGAVHVLNSKGPECVVHMACSLRRTFGFVIDKLPAKGAIADYIERNEEKFKAPKYNISYRNRISRAAFLFFTEKNPSHLTEDEFMDLIKTCNTWVHDYTEEVPEYELAVRVYERSVDILQYILECYEAVRN